MVFIYTSGDAGDGSPGILIPVRRAQTGKGGNYIAAVRIRNFGCHVFGVSSRVDKAHFVTEPLDGSSGNKHRPFQRVVHLAARAAGDGGQQTVGGGDRFFTGVHQHKAAGAIGIFHIPRFKTGLAE